MAVSQNRRVGWLVTATVLFAALAGVDWWTSWLAGSTIHLQGVLSGIALLGGMSVLLLALDGHRRAWASSVYASLVAVVEIIIGAAFVAGLSGLSAFLLPSSLTAKLF